MSDDFRAYCPPQKQEKAKGSFQVSLNAIKKIIDADLSPDQEALLLVEAGKACDLSGEWDQALDTYQQATELYKSDDIKAEILKQTGHIKSKRSEWKAALDAYEASLDILNRLGNLHEIGSIYNSIGYNYSVGNV